MEIRNVAIIAHVDHGKTTLVDALLRQSKTKLSKDVENEICVMDSNDLEKERGITIFSKNASVLWNGIKINIIDTPGHADFGGEVERVLSMADGVILLVDAKEGPMPQTRFVLKKALELKHKVIVVVNKIDKTDARPDFALDKTFDLFVELGADDSYIDFPVLYAAARIGKAGLTAELEKMQDISPIFDAIVKYIPAPVCQPDAPLQMRVTTISGDDFRGRIATGKIFAGKIKTGMEVAHIARDGKIKKCRLTSLMTFVGLGRVDSNEASAGDIVAISGVSDINIGETIADPLNPIALPLLEIDEPTVKMTFTVNDSPFAGREGQFNTSRQIRARLMKELETDMALRVEDSTDGKWIVCGRGELHLAILIERLRREGYEFQVSRPQVIARIVDGRTLVPYDQIFVEVPEQYGGAVIQSLGARNAEMQEMSSKNGITHLEFIVPTRGLFGYKNEFLTATKGLGIMNTLFYDYLPDKENWKEREQGSLVAHESGETRLYGLLAIQDRGEMFVGPGVEVYYGQVVGQNSKKGDMRVNVCKEKKLSNMRSKGDGVSEHFNAPKEMTLEDSLAYIGDDELVEVTPKSVRIRKMILDENEQRRLERGLL